MTSPESRTPNHGSVRILGIDPGSQRTGGWGMRLVDSLAACWGVTDIEDDGKIVWFDLELMPPLVRREG